MKYVMRNGKIVPKSNAASNGPMVISDSMEPTWHPANGRYYTSKSRFRDETRARGYLEVGNEKQRDTRTLDHAVNNDVRRAVEQVRDGYRPVVHSERDF